jgi:hypothetical protein
MAMTKQDDEAAEVTAPHRLPARFAFAIGARVAGPDIVGEVMTQNCP